MIVSNAVENKNERHGNLTFSASNPTTLSDIPNEPLPDRKRQNWNLKHRPCYSKYQETHVLVRYRCDCYSICDVRLTQAACVTLRSDTVERKWKLITRQFVVDWESPVGLMTECGARPRFGNYARRQPQEVQWNVTDKARVESSAFKCSVHNFAIARRKIDWKGWSGTN